MNHEPMSLAVQGVDFQLAIPADSTNACHFREVYQRNGQYEAVMSAILARRWAHSIGQSLPISAPLSATTLSTPPGCWQAVERCLPWKAIPPMSTPSGPPWS